MIKHFKKALFKTFLILLIIFSFGAGFRHVLLGTEKNTQKAFFGEVYDKIKENYWDNISDAQLIDLFRLVVQKTSGKSLDAKISSKERLVKSLEAVSKDLGGEQKEKFAPAIAAYVLGSLNPPGRSGLFTTQQEEQLKNTVNNVNPQKDLYKDLGLSKGASSSAVADVFQKQSEDLKKQNTPQAQQKLREIAYAKDVLTKNDTKLRYDSAQVEPTIFTKIAGTAILYLQFKKFSPTSLDEFQKAFDLYKDDTNLNSLILDLRGNVGGAIDETAYFLGYFLGKGQNAFDFYHQGGFLPFKTPTEKIPSISKYKQIVILVDNQTQSSAEMMAASLKKYHIGVVVGVPTHGWGTVERVFPLDNQISQKEKYSIFLVHSITLRDDNLPIEGRGVEPDVNIKNLDWEQSLYSYFRNPDLTLAVRQILSNPLN